MNRSHHLAILSMLLLCAIPGCGGGSSSGGSSPASTTGSNSQTGTSSGTPQISGITNTVGMEPVPAPPADLGMRMSCVDGPNVQCSGNTILKTENQVSLTSAGVEVFGKSTNDLAAVILNTGLAKGLMPASGGSAELRLTKDNNGTISNPAVLLNNLGISWDAINDRPQIIETFRTTQGRTALDASGKIITGPLPDSSEISFYDYAVKKRNATQAHYANNSYFPRDLTKYPVHCPADHQNCRTTETDGLKINPGNWRSGGTEPDASSIFRLHSDGDLYAGDDVPNADGTRKILPRGDVFGTFYPGFKGYRALDVWSVQYANLATWFTMDTVEIVEYSGGANEHNKSRRGAVAFGDVTNPAAVPAAGTATYSGVAYGWYAPNATDEAVFYRGAATITVNFATRQAKVTVQNTVTFDQALTAVPATITTTTTWAPGETANYMTGAVAGGGGSLPGGVSARYFGPVVTTGNSGTGPSEIGGAFTLLNTATGQVALGGFVGRKQ